MPRSEIIAAALRLYRAAAPVALLVYSPFALVRSLARRRRLGDLRGRLGLTSYPHLDGGIWIHAVSVGEVGVAHALLPPLSAGAPGRRIGVSVTTAAGRELAERTLAPRVSIFAFPFDLSGPVEKALSQTGPGLVLVTETELWPLFLERAARRGIPVALVNGRISERSFARYRLVRRWFARTLRHIALFAMQSPEDARRIEELGAPSERIRLFGNIKYDAPSPGPFADGPRLRRAARGRPIVAAGSTADGEEEPVLEACADLPRRPLLLLAPRRPERFDEVARLIEKRGLRLLRRSSPESPVTSPETLPDVYLLDSIGELASAYAEARLAFIGGSLVSSGGHNPIEAWAAGIPVVAGPHMENFGEIAARGEALGVLRRVEGSAGLRRALAESLDSPSELSQRGERAARFVESSRGAAERTAQAVLELAPHLSVESRLVPPLPAAEDPGERDLP